MSQKKVDAYKERKANREKIIKKEKTILRLEKTVGVALAAAAVIWVGFSVYDKVTDGAMEVKKETVMDTSALDSYVSELAMEHTHTDAETEEENDAQDGDDAAEADTAKEDDAQAGDDASDEDKAEAEDDAEEDKDASEE